MVGLGFGLTAQLARFAGHSPVVVDRIPNGGSRIILSLPLGRGPDLTHVRGITLSAPTILSDAI